MNTRILKQNNFVRLRIVKVGSYFRADISIKTHNNRYYEIGYQCFSQYDYATKEDTYNDAIKWLYDIQKELINKLERED